MKQRATTHSTDVIVVGGGMVGGLTATALAQCGLDVILLEQRTPVPFNAEQHDIRVSAISLATERMFRALGAWDHMRTRRVCPFRRMLVWDQYSNASTLFDSEEISHDWLGHIVENRLIQSALWQGLADIPNVHIECPVTIDSLQIKNNAACIEINGGNQIRASLVVAADGANSQVRELAGIKVDGECYDQHALVATVTTSSPQQDITWQRFTPHGPQAFLPLTGNRASMVWYQSADYIAGLKQLPEEKFLQCMQSEFPDRLAELRTLEQIGSFPLQWQHARNYVLPRIALVGDAAHSVHPLAGQGVNMGMLDAAALVECVVERHALGGDFGDLRTLRRYERWRRGQNQLMIRILDGIHHAFTPEATESSFFSRVLLKTARGAALTAAGKVDVINRFCMKSAMGLDGDLPELAYGRLPKKAMLA
ncbi:hypothetical protein AB833_26015 [Chromatiales bacterium (ex Bugula neritina AB1)]|nr:hypothetical protein AB833_26015 [Chromatiales bacterium (ex Bugula neritina AB1)]